MKIVIISHPDFMRSKSMPLFARMLFDGCGAQEIISPTPFFYNLSNSTSLKKWLGYVDQYLIFPFVLKFKYIKCDRDTVFVFADQALGPWVPWIKNRPHVIHCHDLMALRSALDEISENPTNFTGKIYQKFIRWGFSKGRNFISVSEKTRDDLHRLANICAHQSIVVHNGLNYPYCPLSLNDRMEILKKSCLPVEVRGMLLHVGGRQWYKNRRGVVEMYAAYAGSVSDPLPLWMIGPEDQESVLSAIKQVPPQGKVHIMSGLDSETLHAAYAHAVLMLFPSLDEGFGWPIVEAQACGTPVLTTDIAPMTEVGGRAAFYHYRRTVENSLIWAIDGGNLIIKILSMNYQERADIVEQGLNNSVRFNYKNAITSYLSLYQKALEISNS